uniref:RIIa domain-containing protein n=1 Tax=Plectus sambesii TaxID=2011161 RepID=A0A914VQJ9_9BILA
MAESQRYKVPQGFRPLLEALAREVLRAQPDDIYAFSALFFQVLQRHRSDNPGANVLEDPAAYEVFKADLQSAFSQRDYAARGGNTNNYQKASLGGDQTPSSRRSSTDRPRSPLDDAATKIQAAFRGHMVRAHPEHFGLQTHVGQTGQPTTPDSPLRRRSNEFLNVADTRKDLKRHSVGYVGEFNTPEDRAATKIQAEIRGFLTRRKVSAMKAQNDLAATKIQSHIRGFLTRKHLDEQGLLLPSRSRSSLGSQDSRSEEQLSTRDAESAATKIQAQFKGEE